MQTTRKICILSPIIQFAIILVPNQCWCGLKNESIRPSTSPLIVQNNYLRVRFDRPSGCLQELTDLRTKQNIIDQAQAATSVWQLDLWNSDTPLTAQNATRFVGEVSDSTELRLAWDKFKNRPNLRVVVTISLQNSQPMSRWTISILNLEKIQVKKIRFPRLQRIKALGAEEYLAVPKFMGALAKNPRSLLNQSSRARLSWAYPGEMALQCLALYDDQKLGLYLACDDTAALRKDFAVWGEQQNLLGYELVHFWGNPNKSRHDFSLPYCALIGTFEGDWLTAAERYRDWGTQQSWANKSRLKNRLVPQWLLDTAIWVWNRGRADKVLPPAESLQAQLGLPVSVHWHWWHNGPYDIIFPEYLPPRDGEEKFKLALQHAQNKGMHAIVYMNQRLWGMNTKSWRNENAEPWAVKKSSGEIRVERPCVFDHQPCASMCIATPFWRQKYASLAETMLQDYGVDGVYMDQAVSSLMCYDPDHGHPLGGGNYWMQGFRTLTEGIRIRTADKAPVLLAGEHGCETWLPDLDLFLTLQISEERHKRPGGDGWQVIPFFQAVYHPYAVTYGSYSSLTIPPYDEFWPSQFAPAEPFKLLDDKYHRQFYLEQARAFVWGMQPTVANFFPSQLQTRGRQVAYMMKLARLRYQALKYLLHGSFLRPPQIEVPEVEVDLSRLSIYAGRMGGGTSWQSQFPACLISAWQADDGSVAIVLASIVDEPLPISLVVDPKSYGLIAGGTVYRIAEKGREKFSDLDSNPIHFQLELRPLDALILEFTN